MSSTSRTGSFPATITGKRAYDASKWTFEMDANGVPKKDLTLQDQRCVFQLLKAHYARYTLDTVSKITGTPEKDLLEVYEAYAATGAKGKAGTIMYAMGWTQHTVGVQNIRAMSIIQTAAGQHGGGGRRRQRAARGVQRPGLHRPRAAVPHPARLPRNPGHQLAEARGLPEDAGPRAATR